MKATPTDEVLHLLAVKPLPAWLQVNEQALTPIPIDHPPGNRDRQATEGIHQCSHNPFMDHHQVGEISTHKGGNLLLYGLGAGQAVKLADFPGAKGLAMGKGVTGDLGDPHLLTLQANSNHHIGVGPNGINAQQHHIARTAQAVAHLRREGQLAPPEHHHHQQGQQQPTPRGLQQELLEGNLQFRWGREP